MDFLRIFAGQLRQAGIPFAITSGMACVHYGLQQNTKDSDWIIPADALELHELLTKLEGELPPNPLAEISREELVRAALSEVATLAAAPENEIAKVLPPTDELLP